jgi:predicted TIM-barrel fold metal-dependent hydrolase
MERDSSWGPIPVADAHIHFFSQGFFDAIVATQGELTVESAGAKLGWSMPPREPERLAATWVRELDKQGIAHAALISSAAGDEASVVAAKKAHPERFFAYAMVDPTSGWNPAALLDVDVVCLFPSMHRYSMQGSEARAVFEWAAQARRGIFVHCGVLSVGVRRKLGLQYSFDLQYSNPVDLHSMAIEHPEVPIIIPHFGAGYFRESLMVADLCPNIYLDTSSSNRWMLYQAADLNLRQVFRRALDVAGPHRLLFGSDSSFFPRGWNQVVFEEQAKALYEIDVSKADARAIFGENLLRILAR